MYLTSCISFVCDLYDLCRHKLFIQVKCVCVRACMLHVSVHTSCWWNGLFTFNQAPNYSSGSSLWQSLSIRQWSCKGTVIRFHDIKSFESDLSAYKTDTTHSYRYTHTHTWTCTYIICRCAWIIVVKHLRGHLGFYLICIIYLHIVLCLSDSYCCKSLTK